MIAGRVYDSKVDRGVKYIPLTLTSFEFGEIHGVTPERWYVAPEGYEFDYTGMPPTECHWSFIIALYYKKIS